ncbi:unnamed protein product [Phaedon cochleariae]|uniref:PH domain-containing protein n=1 Tax=Phaedon cochleariae TaxID=80249 RepID=A0A9N9SBW2_PHACE|nr:unnamed protein product [Phaedon cochleariae]
MLYFLEPSVRMSELPDKTLFSSNESIESKTKPCDVSESSIDTPVGSKNNDIEIKIKLDFTNSKKKGTVIPNEGTNVIKSTSQREEKPYFDDTSNSVIGISANENISFKNENNEASSRNNSPNKVLENAGQISTMNSDSLNISKFKPIIQQNIEEVDETNYSYKTCENGQVRSNETTILTPGNTTNIFHSTMLSSFQYLNQQEKLKSSMGDYDEKISALIHLLIMEKYNSILKDFRERSMKRQKYCTSEKSEDEKFQQFLNTQWENKETENTQSENDDLGFNSSGQNSPEPNLINCFAPKNDIGNILRDNHEGENSPELNFNSSEMRPENGRSLDSGLNDTKDSLESLCTYPKAENKQDSTVDYNEDQFLSMALGKEIGCSSPESQNEFSNYYSTPAEFRTYGTEKSIGSSNISTLVSSNEHRKSDDIYSYYSAVIKREKRSPRPKNISISKPIFNSVSTNDYESLDNWKMSSKEEMLMQENGIQQEIIHQVSKALTVCRTTPEIFDRETLIEAEKILLVASYKKDIITEQLNKTLIGDKSKDCATATIRMSNMKFSYGNRIHHNNRHKHYFLCILHCGSKIVNSEMVMMRGKEIVFEECFQFENISPEFEITVNIFALTVKKMSKKAKENKNCFGRRNKPSMIESMQSSFVLWGKSTLKPTDFSRETPTSLNLSNMPVGAEISSCFAADIQLSLKVLVSEKGFLTIGTDYKGCPVWNRKWCVLDGSRIKYWNYPSQENVMEPQGQLDLLQCTTNQLKHVDREVCPRPKTLALKIEEDGSTVKELFLSADSQTELEQWQKQLNLVLEYLRKWKNINCYLEN